MFENWTWICINSSSIFCLSIFFLCSICTDTGIEFFVWEDLSEILAGLALFDELFEKLFDSDFDLLEEDFERDDSETLWFSADFLINRL